MQTVRIFGPADRLIVRRMLYLPICTVVRRRHAVAFAFNLGDILTLFRILKRLYIFGEPLNVFHVGVNHNCKHGHTCNWRVVNQHNAAVAADGRTQSAH